MDRSLHILILAAGRASRMQGRDKLLEPINGEPLLVRMLRLALETGCPVHVVLPPDRPLRIAAIGALPVHRVIAEHAADGMSESLKAGLAALPHTVAVMVLLADLPEIDSADLKAMIAAHHAHPAAIIRATSQAGTPGHPVIFPGRLRADLVALSGDEGARLLLKRHAEAVVPVALPDEHATTDLDTPDDWAQWRRARGIPN